MGGIPKPRTALERAGWPVGERLTAPVSIRASASLLLLVVLGAAACGGIGGTASVPTASSPRADATIVPTAPSTPSPRTITYVAFGDSWPFGGHCNGCRPFPVLVRDGLAEATGGEIKFLNDVTNGGTAANLALEMAKIAKIRADIAAADIIVIAIGGNDFEPAFEASAAGTCGGADDLDCFRSVRDTLRAAYEAMLAEIDSLRAGKPTAVRMVTTSNEFLADPGLIEIFGPDFGAKGGVAVTAMNRDAQCEVAAAHHAVCIDLGLALNGPNLTIPQDVNTQEAMQKVADAILAAGLPELQP